MAETYLAFGLHKGTGAISKAIQWQTRSEYSHVSVITGHYLLEAKEGKGVIHERRAAAVLDAEPVDVVFVPCTFQQRADALAFLTAQIGKKYDWTGVLRFISRRTADREASKTWFCSELAFAACQHVGIDLLRGTEAWEVSPGLFARSPLLRASKPEAAHA